MLDYKNIIESKDKEVFSPVDGTYNPLSYNNIKHMNAVKAQNKQNSAIAGMFSSLFK